MAELFYDEFTDNNSADINGSTPSDAGASWSKVLYSSGSIFCRDISSGRADSVSGSATDYWLYTAQITGGTYSDDQEAELNAAAAGSTQFRSLILRWQDANNFISVLWNNTACYSIIWNGGSSTQTTLATGQTFTGTNTYKATITGTTLQFLKNGASVYSGSHTVPSSGTPGMGYGKVPGSSLTHATTSAHYYYWFKAYGTLVAPPVPVGFGLSGGLKGFLGGRL
jgi:hypothetical protein